MKTELALRNGGPITKTQITEIKEKHAYIVQANQSMLVTAMEIGDWFIGCKHKVKHGTWGKWLKTNFPEIHVSTIAAYVQLAQHRQFLESKFQFSSTRRNFDSKSSKEREPGILELDYYRDPFRAPGIKEAQRAIRESNQRLKSDRRIIEVESVTEKKLGRGNAERAISWPTPAERKEEQALEEPVQAPTEDPKRVLDRMLKNYLYHQTLADEAIVEIRDYIKLAALNNKTIRYCVDIAAEDAPKLKAKLLNELL
jgi:hypothetical protein